MSTEKPDVPMDFGQMRRVGQGMYEDAEGVLHIDVEEWLGILGLPDTPANQERVTAEFVAAARDALGEVPLQVIDRRAGRADAGITWFSDSPDAGTPGCLCSACGLLITGGAPARLFDPDTGLEARFHWHCVPAATPETGFGGARGGGKRQAAREWGARVAGEPFPAEFRRVFRREYLPPLGTPLRWQDELSGRLPAAVMAYYRHGADPATHKTPSREQMDLVIEYVRYVLDAPCWSGGAALDALRRRAAGLRTADDLDRFIGECLEIGLDPL